MFNILSVRLVNFRSYNGAHNFKFPDKPGLYLLTGRNDVNPRLGANGTGKSTLLDAIFWCLYGRTTRGLKASDVITWGKKTANVSVTLCVGEHQYQIERVQNPNGLTLDERPIDQLELNKTIRLTPDQFEIAVMLPQFGESFFDLKPEAKLKLFTDIMGLDFWIDKSNEANDLNKMIENEQKQLQHDLSNLKGAAEAITGSLADLKVKQEQRAERKLLEIKALQDNLAQLLKDRPKLEKELETARLCLKKANVKFDLFKTDLEAAHEFLRQYHDERNTCQNKLSRLAYEVQVQSKALEKLTGLDATCPVCLQNVDEKHLAAEVKALEAHLATIKKTMKPHRDENTRLSNEIDKGTAAIEQIKADLQTVSKNQIDFSKEVRLLEDKLRDFTHNERAYHTQINDIKKATDPYAETITQQGQKLTKLRLDTKDLSRKVDQLSNELIETSFWAAAFKRVRLFIIETTLQQLELEINNNLSSLGLTDWRIELDVERENKSGGITKGFTVLVQAPGHAEPVPFAAWSGGETQRLRLAGDLGLGNLIMERAGLTNTIEMYDEPSRHLSQAGMLDLAETLADRAEATGRRVLMIDHNTLNFGGFIGTMIVVKDKDGSRIEPQ